MTSVEWLFPANVEEAVGALAEQGNRAVAGGTTVFDLLKLGHPLPRRFVDISRLPLGRIVETPGSLTIGALCSNTSVANSPVVRLAFPAIPQAILSGASQQIRNAASVGGNIMQATRCPYFRTTSWPCNRRSPGSGCEALSAPTHAHAILGTSKHCIAVHPSDMVVALAALDATVLARTPDGDLTIPITDFYTEPDGAWDQGTMLPSKALITAVKVPHTDASRRSGYLKLRTRASYEFAMVSVAAALSFRSGKVEAASIALGGVGTRPWRRKEAERLLVGEKLDQGPIDSFCDALLDGADLRPETEHKLALSRRAVHRVLRALADQ